MESEMYDIYVSDLNRLSKEVKKEYMNKYYKAFIPAHNEILYGELSTFIHNGGARVRGLRERLWINVDVKYRARDEVSTISIPLTELLKIEELKGRWRNIVSVES